MKGVNEMPTFNIGDWNVTESDTEYLLTGWNASTGGNPTDIYIPGEYNGKQVCLNNLKIFPDSMTMLQIKEENAKKVKLNTTNLSTSFMNKDGLISIDLSGLDTGEVTDMSSMFFLCRGLKELKVTNFNTDNVTNMAFMFSDCRELKTLDVSSFNTENVGKNGGNMKSMFYGCSLLKTLTLNPESFQTSNVSSMNSMFSTCMSLVTLDVSSFDTSNVTDMSQMFYFCSDLIELDVKGFNTDNVTNMGSMFSGCRGLKTLDVSSFNTSKVTNMSSMFSSCRGLATLNFSTFDTDNVTNMSSMFSSCSGLKTLDVSSFNTSNVTNMSFMFSGCSGLATLNLSTFDTGKVTNMSSMFSGCTNLKIVDLSLCTTSTASTTNMFSEKSNTPLVVITPSTAINAYDFLSVRPQSSAIFRENDGGFSDETSSKSVTFDYVYETREELESAISMAASKSPIKPTYFFLRWERNLPTTDDSLEELWNQANAIYTAVWFPYTEPGRNCHYW